MQKLRELRKKENLTQSKLAAKIGVSRSTIAMYETDASEPDLETLTRIADFFGVSVDLLLDKKPPSNKEQAFTTKKYVEIPVFRTIPAGVPIDKIDQSYIEKYEDVDASLLKDGDTYFFLKVQDSSMSPKFENDDTVLLKFQPDCSSGDFCAVSINHTECMLKKVIKKASGMTLQPLNSDYEPLYFNNKEISDLPVTILGVVKEIRRKI